MIGFQPFSGTGRSPSYETSNAWESIVDQDLLDPPPVIPPDDGGGADDGGSGSGHRIKTVRVGAHAGVLTGEWA